jgi:hypothetical protein
MDGIDTLVVLLIHLLQRYVVLGDLSQLYVRDAVTSLRRLLEKSPPRTAKLRRAIGDLNDLLANAGIPPLPT